MFYLFYYGDTWFRSILGFFVMGIKFTLEQILNFMLKK